MALQKYFFLLTLIVSSFFLSAQYRSDYCKIEKEKCNGKPHTACSGFCTDADCKALLGKCTYLKIVPMTNDLKNLILNEHNKYRNEIAGGHLLGFPPSSRMMKMVTIFFRVSIPIINSPLFSTGMTSWRYLQKNTLSIVTSSMINVALQTASIILDKILR